jgi:hypothetical protein
MPAGVTRLFVQIFNGQATMENLISEGHVELHEVLRKGEHDGKVPRLIESSTNTWFFYQLRLLSVGFEWEEGWTDLSGTDLLCGKENINRTIN